MNSRVVEQYPDYDAIPSKSDSIKGVTEECQSDGGNHRSFLQRIWLQFPLISLRTPTELLKDRKVPQIGENGPLLVSDESAMDIEPRDSSFVGGSFTEQHKSKKEWAKSILMASIFLRDYELARPPTLPTHRENISPSTLITHRWRYSLPWRIITNAATFALFFSSGLESIGATALPFSLNVIAVHLFCRYTDAEKPWRFLRDLGRTHTCNDDSALDRDAPSCHLSLDAREIPR
jgi:hypothetical protein